jgi:hypothetical protein
MFILIFCLLAVFQLPRTHAGGAWTNGEYFGELSMNVTQMIKGCTLADYDNSPISAAVFNRTLEQTIAGCTGLPIRNISNLFVYSGPFYADATPLINPNITIFYRLRARDDIDYEKAATKLLSNVADGSFDNLLNLFAVVNKAPACLVNSRSGPIDVQSLVPTYSPTPAPTFSPTAFDTEQFGHLLKRYVVLSSIIGSVLGLMLIYYGYWGFFYLSLWIQARQDRLEAELEAEVNFHNKKLQDRFVKADVGASPHTSKMRENFKKQFGHLPSDDEMLRSRGEDSGAVPLTNLSGSSAPSRTLATRLPASSSPTRPVRSAEADVEAGRSAQDNEEESKSRIEALAQRPAVKADTPAARTTRDVNIELTGGLGNTGEDKSNRLADKGSRRAFGFADDQSAQNRAIRRG